MLTKTARVADKAPAAPGSVSVRKDDPSSASPQHRVSDYRAMGQGDLHPNELYS